MQPPKSKCMMATAKAVEGHSTRVNSHQQIAVGHGMHIKRKLNKERI